MDPSSNPVDIEIRLNEMALDDLRKAIYSNLAFCFVGAGCSSKLVYPGWEELISMMEDEAKRLNPQLELNHYAEFNANKQDALWYAEVLKNHLADAYHPLINTVFKPKEDRENTTTFHKSLLKIPFRHYLTTNYDTVLEYSASRTSSKIASFAWHDKDTLVQFFREISEPVSKDSRYIFHIHGIYNMPESVILTEQDYLKLYADDGLVRKVLWSIVASYRICFVGFRLQDLDVLDIFRKVRWDCRRGLPRHYAIMEGGNPLCRKGQREYLREKYGIDPIFFSKVSGENEYIEQEAIIEKLSDAKPRNIVEDIASRLEQISDGGSSV